MLRMSTSLACEVVGGHVVRPVAGAERDVLKEGALRRVRAMVAHVRNRVLDEVAQERAADVVHRERCH